LPPSWNPWSSSTPEGRWEEPCSDTEGSGRVIARWMLGLALLLALASSLGGAWVWRGLGLEILEWAAPQISPQDVRLARLTLRRTLPGGSQLRLDARDLRLSWAGLASAAPYLETLESARLKLDWRPAKAGPDQPLDAPKDYRPLIANLVWLTRVTRIQTLQIDLPCPQVRCRREAGPLRLESELVPAVVGKTWKGRRLATLPRLAMAGVEIIDPCLDLLFLGSLDFNRGKGPGSGLALQRLLGACWTWLCGPDARQVTT
jgi:hypothetical protein